MSDEIEIVPGDVVILKSELAKHIRSVTNHTYDDSIIMTVSGIFTTPGTNSECEDVPNAIVNYFNGGILITGKPLGLTWVTE